MRVNYIIQKKKKNCTHKYLELAILKGSVPLNLIYKNQLRGEGNQWVIRRHLITVWEVALNSKRFPSLVHLFPAPRLIQLPKKERIEKCNGFFPLSFESFFSSSLAFNAGVKVPIVTAWYSPGNCTE